MIAMQGSLINRVFPACGKAEMQIEERFFAPTPALPRKQGREYEHEANASEWRRPAGFTITLSCGSGKLQADHGRSRPFDLQHPLAANTRCSAPQRAANPRCSPSPPAGRSGPVYTPSPACGGGPGWGPNNHYPGVPAAGSSPKYERSASGGLGSSGNIRQNAVLDGSTMTQQVKPINAK